MDVFPTEATLSQVPIFQVSVVLSVYSSIKSPDARRIFLALVRAVGESLDSSFVVDKPKDINKDERILT